MRILHRLEALDDRLVPGSAKRERRSPGMALLGVVPPVMMTVLALQRDNDWKSAALFVVAGFGLVMFGVDLAVTTGIGAGEQRTRMWVTVTAALATAVAFSALYSVGIARTAYTSAVTPDEAARAAEALVTASMSGDYAVCAISVDDRMCRQMLDQVGPYSGARPEISPPTVYSTSGLWMASFVFRTKASRPGCPVTAVQEDGELRFPIAVWWANGLC